ncbi:hypothetical protein J3R30DRAFT_3710141 [Lentinula aciculospora]|uniref:DUF6535 domain-containing protein n=1 Tax=Lentinula aciculospora TaxID=153920 RepID=A0A9W9A1R9_9AGAR|nr:hypothetical protein J3R30DRAFT_3710141 [Lentinula aciculospora]
MAARSFKEGAPSIKSSNTTNTKTQTDPLPANGDAGVGNLQGEGDRESVFLGDVPRLWQEGDPYRFSPKRRGDPWEESMKRVDLYDDEMCRAWKEDVDTLLVFAGLFSAAVTAFIIESYKWLQPNNFNSDTILLMLQRIALDSNVQVSTSGQTNFTTASAVRINAVWFLSLIFSLSTVLIGILCKQWLREHRRDTPCSSSKEALELRQLRFESLEKWGIPALLASLPLILQLALVLFFYGILDLLWSLNIVVAAICTAATAISVSIPFLTTILPTCYLFKYSSLIDEDEAHICPYKSPQAWLFYKLMTFLPFNGHTPFQNWASGDLFLLRKHSPLKRLQLHSVFLLRGLRWMVKTFCDSSVMAKHMFHCFQNLPVDIAAFATKREGEFSRDTIYYHFFENSAWDLDLGKFLAELFLRQINSPAPAHSGRAVGDPLRSFWNLAVLDFVGDGQEALQLHLEFLQQIIATIRCYCAEDRITLFDMNPLMIVCKGLWRHPDPVIRQQSICIVDDFEAWISRTSEELQREFIPSFASSITDTIFSEDERAPTSALILSDRGRAFIKLLDKYLAAQDIDLDKYSLQEVPMSWQEAKAKVIRLSGLPSDFFEEVSFDSHIPIPNNVGGSLVASDSHTIG